MPSWSGQSQPLQIIKIKDQREQYEMMTDQLGCINMEVCVKSPCNTALV